MWEYTVDDLNYYMDILNEEAKKNEKGGGTAKDIRDLFQGDKKVIFG